MSDLPPPETSAADERVASPPAMITRRDLLFRFRRLVLAMLVIAAVLAVLPVPSGVHVVVLLVVPVLVLVVAVRWNDLTSQRFVYRYAGWLWRNRRDRDATVEVGERAGEIVDSRRRRTWVLLGLFVAVFAIGLVLAAASAGISEAIHG